ncbi:hypothetical protein KKF84_16945, partial [Myxococcota bacterium]|nr:hypothetical protein [Myxococcota bacterium]
SAGGRTVIPAAVSFTEYKESGLFAQLTMEQAVSQLGAIDTARALPFQGTRHLFYLPPIILLFMVITKIAPEPDYGFNQFGPITHTGLLFDIKPNISTDDPQFAVLKDELKDLMRKTKLLGSKDTKEMVRQLQDLISDVEKGKITPFQAAKKAEAIRKKLEDGAKDPFLEERETAFKEIANQLKNDRDLKDLAKELMKNNMDGVQRELMKLQKKMSQMTEKQKEAIDKKLEKAAENAAKNLDKKSKDFANKANKAEKKGNKKEAGALKKESRKMKNAAETARKLFKSDEEKRKYMQKRMDQAKKNNMKKMAKAIEKALKNMEKSQQGKKGNKDDPNNKSQQGNKGQKGKQGDKGNKNSANKGQKPGNKGQKGGDKKSQQGAMKNMQKALDRYARKRSESSNSNKAKMTAEEIKEAMKRLKKGGGGQCKNKGSGGIKDFFKRARGDKPGGSKPGGKPGGKSAGKGQGGNKPGGYKPGGAGNKPGGQGGKGQGKSAGKGQGGKGKGKGGKGWGTGNGGKLFGKETRIAHKSSDKRLTTKRHGAGPSRFDVILGASEKGFSKTSYKNVYNKYREQAKEVIKDEKIPPGYKHLVKVYYRLIRPRN